MLVDMFYNAAMVIFGIACSGAVFFKDCAMGRELELLIGDPDPIALRPG